MQDTIIENATAVLKDRVVPHASVLIRGQLIEEISKQPGFSDKYPGARKIDADGLSSARLHRHPFRQY